MIGVKNRCVARGEKISFSKKRGEGRNIVFVPKYRPLVEKCNIKNQISDTYTFTL
jgi:hypothetical protein